MFSEAFFLRVVKKKKKPNVSETGRTSTSMNASSVVTSKHKYTCIYTYAFVIYRPDISGACCLKRICNTST